jgi:hypothetical protein
VLTDVSEVLTASIIRAMSSVVVFWVTTYRTERWLKLLPLRDRIAQGVPYTATTTEIAFYPAEF